MAKVNDARPAKGSPNKVAAKGNRVAYSKAVAMPAKKGKSKGRSKC